MKLRLHEIEFGSNDVQKNTDFFTSLLGLKTSLQQDGLTVFDAGLQGMDFNVSTHLPQGIVCLSFLTDDLEEMQRRLNESGLAYRGPMPSHLGMECVQFKSPGDCVIKINQPGPSSPEWLKV